jgi:hypothetical protein
MENFNYSSLIPLGSALLGACIAIIGQIFVKRIDKKRELEKERREIIAYCLQFKTQLIFQLKDLAYFRQNTELQWLHHELELDTAKKSKFLEEHYKSNLNAWDCEKNVTQTISLYVAQITKFEIITNYVIDFDTIIHQIQNMNFESAKSYARLKVTPTDTQIVEDITQLTTRYSNKLKAINNGIDLMLSYN